MGMRLLLFAISICAAAALTPQEEEAEVAKKLAEYRRLSAEKIKRMAAQQRNDMLVLPDHDFGKELVPKKKTEFESNIETGDNTHLYQGDIQLRLEQVNQLLEEVKSDDTKRRRRKRTAAKMNVSKWDKKIPISYVFNPRYDKDNIPHVRAAFQIWEDNTCLNFKENGTEQPKLQIIQGSGCYSTLGMISRSKQYQDLSLGVTCFGVGVASHEIAHALGCIHTHSREDRDAHIQIDYGIVAGTEWEDQFTMESNTDSMGIPYDFASVLHYPPLFRRDTIIRAYDWRYTRWMGQRDRPVFSDVKLVNKMYNCQEDCPAPHIRCNYGGFVNSKKCNECICPEYFTGPRCQTINPGYGIHAQNGRKCSVNKLITIETPVFSMSGSVGVEGDEDQPEMSACYWLLRCEPRRRITFEIELAGFEKTQDAKCALAGVEINDGTFDRRGMLLCGKNDGNSTVTSVGNVMIIKVYSKKNKSMFRFKNIRMI